MNEEKFKQMARDAYYTRGLIINETAYIERSIDEYIARHFCKDEAYKTEFIEMCLSDKINLNSKQKLFNNILDKHELDFLKKYPDFKNDINEILKMRNVLAHQVLDTTPFGRELYDKEEVIGFIKFNAEYKREFFSKESSTQLVFIIKSTVSRLNELVPDLGRSFTEE